MGYSFQFSYFRQTPSRLPQLVMSRISGKGSRSMLREKLVKLGERLVVLGQKQAIQVKARASCQTAFVKKYTAAPNFSFPRDFNFSENGILFAESIKEGKSTLLFLYWSSADRASTLEAKVQGDLSLEHGEVVGSIMQVATTQKTTWLERSEEHTSELQ